MSLWALSTECPDSSASFSSPASPSSAKAGAQHRSRSQPRRAMRDMLAIPSKTLGLATAQTTACASNNRDERDERYTGEGEPIPDHGAMQQLEMPAEHVRASTLPAASPCDGEGDDFAHETKDTSSQKR